MPGELESRHVIQCNVYIVLDHRSEQLITHPATFMNEQRDKQHIVHHLHRFLPMHFLYYKFTYRPLAQSSGVFSAAQCR